MASLGWICGETHFSAHCKAMYKRALRSPVGLVTQLSQFRMLPIIFSGFVAS
jgi:hypothetical protein